MNLLNRILWRSVFLKEVMLIVGSALLLTLSFPKFSWYVFAFVALIPLCHVLDHKRAGAAFAVGYGWGLLLFWMMLYWIGFVTWLGAALMIFYLALFPAFFAVGYVWMRDLPLWHRLLAVPSWWVVLEFARGKLLTGFGWISLAESQYLNTMLIQISDVTGMHGVSFIIVLVTLIIKEAWSRRHRAACKWLIGLMVFLLLAIYGYGYGRMMRSSNTLPTVKVGVLQGNIPLEVRWNPDFRDRIVAKHLMLSQGLLNENPDVVVWPETSFPGIIWEAPDLFNRIREAAALWQVPQLVGVVTELNRQFFNAAVLIDEQGHMAAQYHKQHLVPFGEYIPFRRYFPFLEHIVPIDDFTPGTAMTLIPVRDAWAGVMICFEDTFAYLGRALVQEGAGFLINMTNDAWFRDTKEPYLHLAASVFRAVEFKRAVVRAANTGVSAMIDPHGRIQHQVQDDQGDMTFVAGADVVTVPVNKAMTFYTKYGNVFTYACFLCILMTLAILNISYFRKGIKA